MKDINRKLLDGASRAMFNSNYLDMDAFMHVIELVVEDEIKEKGKKEHDWCESIKDYRDMGEKFEYFHIYTATVSDFCDMLMADTSQIALESNGDHQLASKVYEIINKIHDIKDKLDVEENRLPPTDLSVYVLNNDIEMTDCNTLDKSEYEYKYNIRITQHHNTIKVIREKNTLPNIPYIPSIYDGKEKSDKKGNLIRYTDEEIRRMYQTTGVESTQNVTCATNEETNLK